MVSLYVDGVEASERSFDFSKLPNIQEVDFEVRWKSGGLLWIPTALSTLRLATSPRLSTIRLNFALHSTANSSTETLATDLGREIRWIAGEFARIKCEFEGAVSLTLVRDPGFKAVLDMLSVRFHFVNNTL